MKRILSGRLRVFLKGSRQSVRNLFSNKAYISEKESAYRNDCGTELSFRNEVITVALSIKDKGSANIMDTFFGYETRHYDEDKIVQYAKKLHNDYFRTVEVEDGVYPVIIGNDFLTQAVNHFEGRLYTLGASLLSGKLGEKVFNERVSIISDYMSPRGSQCFFDDEGVFFEDGKYYYVKNGVLTGLLATKKYKNDFGLEISGCAAAAYDSIPNASVRENGFFVQPTDKNIKEITAEKQYCSIPTAEATSRLQAIIRLLLWSDSLSKTAK